MAARFEPIVIRESRPIINAMSLSEAEFRTRCDDAFNKLNRALDVVAEEHDVEILLQNGVLSIGFEEPNPGKIVISPQTPTRQIWISAQSTSFKLDWNGSAFVFPATGETLNQLIGRLTGEQLGVDPIAL
jgi:iron donor protein CyaY